MENGRHYGNSWNFVRMHSETTQACRSGLQNCSNAQPGPSRTSFLAFPFSGYFLSGGLSANRFGFETLGSEHWAWNTGLGTLGLKHWTRNIELETLRSKAQTDCIPSHLHTKPLPKRFLLSSSGARIGHSPACELINVKFNVVKLCGGLLDGV